MKRIDNCYSCWFWEGQGIRQRGPKGICHRYPPMVTPRNPDGVFPTTLSTDWCGEWKRISLRQPDITDEEEIDDADLYQELTRNPSQ